MQYKKKVRENTDFWYQQLKNITNCISSLSWKFCRSCQNDKHFLILELSQIKVLINDFNWDKKQPIELLYWLKHNKNRTSFFW